ncbi:MBL fold/beta-CASP domain-containing RNA metallo-hydrolase [Idiomarina xiamenensis]|uniref:Beta-lactamase domain-containing protein n=1 Tax=Idiomarina xiamenensis 10-D-4 TaxID=740709 RepID=K2JKA1_9GAMM|nr:MBL fold/beta-CASP domain-containing RNA metallo-hydrolase [Idiomarina xiamenensis]EKE83891.1 beta-lactamase domain-containing protein [Idiomarina xiamenensis 10-D-4]
MYISHHGAAQGVTGSCHELHIYQQHSLLIDCGLFQGEEQQAAACEFFHQGIKAVFITHCHVDHVGRLPALFDAGYQGPVYCSNVTAALLPTVMSDALHLTHADNESYAAACLAKLKHALCPLPTARWLALAELPSVRIRLLDSGHILGACSLEVEYQQQRVVFSGDVGNVDTPIVHDPQSPEHADLLVLESTYGDRQHDNREQRQQRLQQIIEQAISNRGTVMIPAFAIGRTQELLYELHEIIQQQPQWQALPVVLDSPLATRITEQYQTLANYWDESAQAHLRRGDDPLNFPLLHRVSNYQQHIGLVNRLRQFAEPCIVIAGSGMCTGGRIQHYLQALLPDARHDLLFVGYQAHGTPGRQIQSAQRGDWVTIAEQQVQVNAAIHTISGYSAHADQAGLLNYIENMNQLPKAVRLVHGDNNARRELAKAIKRRFNIPVSTTGKKSALAGAHTTTQQSVRPKTLNREESQ